MGWMVTVLQLIGPFGTLVAIRFQVSANKVMRNQEKMAATFKRSFALKRVAEIVPFAGHPTIGHRSEAYWRYQMALERNVWRAIWRRFFFLDEYKAYPVYIQKMYSKRRYKNYYTGKITDRKILFYYRRKNLKKLEEPMMTSLLGSPYNSLFFWEYKLMQIDIKREIYLARKP